MAACQQVIKFVITLLVSVVVALLDGKQFVDAVGEGLLSAGLGLIPGMSKSTFKKIISVIKSVSKRTATIIKRLKLKKIKEHVDATLTGWEIGSAVGSALKSKDYFKELVF